MSDLLRKAYRLGFEASGEGYNGEYPFAGIDLERDARWTSMRDDDLSDLAAPVAAPVQVKALEDGLDWVNIARVAGTHGIRYRTNQGLVDFLNAIALSAISGDTSNG